MSQTKQRNQSEPIKNLIQEYLQQIRREFRNSDAELTDTEVEDIVQDVKEHIDIQLEQMKVDSSSNSIQIEDAKNVLKQLGSPQKIVAGYRSTLTSQDIKTQHPIPASTPGTRYVRPTATSFITPNTFQALGVIIRFMGFILSIFITVLIISFYFSYQAYLNGSYYPFPMNLDSIAVALMFFPLLLLLCINLALTVYYRFNKATQMHHYIIYGWTVVSSCLLLFLHEFAIYSNRVAQKNGFQSLYFGDILYVVIPLAVTILQLLIYVRDVKISSDQSSYSVM